MQFILNAERGWGSSSNLIIVNIHHAIDLLSDPDTFV